MGRSCSQNGKCRNGFKILKDKPTGKRALERWEETITMDFKEIIISMRNWLDSAQDMDYWRALLNATLNYYS